MTTENVKAFFEALSQNESIQQALKEKEAAYTGTKEDREAIVNEILIPVAEAAGFTFTLDEVNEFEKSMQVKGELNEDELKAVAGGDSIGEVIVETTLPTLADNGYDLGLCVAVGYGAGYSCEGLGFAVCIGLGM